MSDQHEPIRFRDANSGADPLLRQLLDSAAQSGPSPAHKRALDEAILNRIAAHADGGKGSVAKWLVVVGLVTTAGLGITWQSLQPERASQSEPARQEQAKPNAQTEASPSLHGATAPAAASGTLPRAPEPPSVAPTQSARPIEHTASSPRRERNQSRVAKPAAKEPSAPALPTHKTESVVAQADSYDSSAVPEQTSVAPELELLARAQRALRDDAAEALELTGEHARAYPTGAFVEEREAITIEALIATGQVTAARTRGRAFLARHKRSAYAARVARLLQAHP